MTLYFIDEAQDLSPIQWKMFDVLKENSKHVILAGDDDQAIYGWAGADVKRFQQEPAKEIVLPQSYRVPKLVQHIANNILSRIPDERRLKKNGKHEMKMDSYILLHLLKMFLYMKGNG